MNGNLSLCWHNISLYTTTKRGSIVGKKKVERKKLLSNVSGMVKSGTISAILGPSGAGKTTLLAAVSQRSCGFIKGEIHLNGHPVDKELMVKMCGFVPQHDLALQYLTVKEHLYFMARLKMDRRVSANQQTRIINSILQDLGLYYCTLTQLCNLSGGERKRVSLAVQLLTDPPILICDEPTTGLDSYTANNVIGLLRQLSSRGKAVLCSVHQPASGIFEMFDTVSLLVSGGRLAYFGEVNGAKKYFAELDLVCPAAYNTAEFVVKQLNTTPDLLTDNFKNSFTYLELVHEIETVKKSLRNYQLVYGMDEQFLKFYSVQTPSQKMQLKLLIWRSAMDLLRNSRNILLRFIMYLLTGLLISSPYIGTQLNQEGVQNIQGLNYSVITETVFSQSAAVLHTFPAEIPILMREIGNGVYRPAPYYISKVMMLIPRAIIETLIFCLVIHFLVDIKQESQSFFTFAVPVLISAVTSSAYGCCVSAMFENIRTASLFSVPVDLISYTFCGIFIQLR
ncbi:protein scarlet-like isoform X2 [Rhodnius prolixus]|uniref:protein scarlet-like isoform X2 n=1 Tax=Rhodnius prolixus TaxID=13249 RepID=UPI003D1888CD